MIFFSNKWVNKLKKLKIVNIICLFYNKKKKKKIKKKKVK